MAIGINGMGRIGRLSLRAGLGGVFRDDGDPRKANRLNVAHVNEIKGGAATAAHLLEFDSTHGRWRAAFTVEDGAAVTIDGRRIGFSAKAEPGDVPWGDLGCDVVLECTGKFLQPEQLQGYFGRGVKRIIVAAPVKDDRALNIVVGVNDNLYDPARHRLLTAASCTTNCLAPIAKVIHDRFGFRSGSMTTIHSYTNDQKLLDLPHKDLRRARAAALSMIPTSTGAAKALHLVVPELKGKLDGFAMRVPTPNVSVVDLVVSVEKCTTVEEVNAAMKTASDGPMKGILGYSEAPLVSADFKGDERSSIVDAPLTRVIAGNLVKVISWYDNEWGYSCRVRDLIRFLSAKGL